MDVLSYRFQRTFTTTFNSVGPVRGIGLSVDSITHVCPNENIKISLEVKNAKKSMGILATEFCARISQRKWEMPI